MWPGKVKTTFFIQLLPFKQEFYYEGSSYGLFAGHDCSICLAKMELKAEYLNQYGKIDLTE